jgi:AAA+ ATPase superfamily predicted ATPase
MANPFLFGKIVTGKHFCDRENEKRLLIENIQGGQSVVVISPRRMGKSSLLSVVSAHLESVGMVCGKIDFYALKSAAKIVGETARVCAEMILHQETSLKRFLSTTASIFKRTRIAIEPSPDGTGVSVKPDIGLPVEIRATLTEAILGLDGFLSKRRKRGLLVMDEFQEVLGIDREGSTSLEAEFRTVVQSTKNLSFAFLGSQASLMSDMFTGRKRPFFQAAKIIELGPIDHKSLQRYIRKRFRSVDVTIENTEVIPELVQGHPDYTQRLSSHLYDILESMSPDSKAFQLNNTILEQGMQQMIEACSLIFIPEWEAYPLRQQQVLSLLAEHGPLKRVPSIYLAEYDMSHTSFNTAVKELLRKGTVRRVREAQYELADPIFAKWIRRR